MAQIKRFIDAEAFLYLVALFFMTNLLVSCHKGNSSIQCRPIEGTISEPYVHFFDSVRDVKTIKILSNDSLHEVLEIRKDSGVGRPVFIPTDSGCIERRQASKGLFYANSSYDNEFYLRLIEIPDSTLLEINSRGGKTVLHLDDTSGTNSTNIEVIENLTVGGKAYHKVIKLTNTQITKIHDWTSCGIVYLAHGYGVIRWEMNNGTIWEVQR
jgi:hypothetical protein